MTNRLILECDLVWPPSVNHYWAHTGYGKSRRTYLTARAKQFCADVQAVVLQSRRARLSTARLMGEFEFCPPDRRKRDLDNLLKGLLDAMGKGGLYADDSQFDDLRLRRGQCVPQGMVRVKVWEMSSD